MTRGFQFTLPLAGVNYNLWTLIKATIVGVDTYMPKTICELKIKFPLLAANSGAYLSIYDRNSNTRIDYLISDGEHVSRTSGNNICLEDFVLNGDTANVLVDISFAAR
jgi:hypothetical protein